MQIPGLRVLTSAIITLAIWVFLASFTNLSAQQHTGAPALTLSQIEQLVAAHTPDATLHAAIKARGLAFKPTDVILDQLRAKGAGSLVLADIRTRIPEDSRSRPMPKSEMGSSDPNARPIPLLQAKIVISAEINALLHDLDQGAPSDARPFLASNIAQDSQALDSICRPFTYRAHAIEAIVERPDSFYEARVRVLYKPLEERALTLVFHPENGTLQLVRIGDPAVDEWIREAENIASDSARKFLYAAKAGEGSVLASLVAPGIDTKPYTMLPCWQAVLESIDKVEGTSVSLEQMNGLKIRVDALVNVRLGSDGITATHGSFWFDKIGGEYKIVSMVPLGNEHRVFNIAQRAKRLNACSDIADNFFAQVTAPDMERTTLLRFGLPAPPASASEPAKPVTSPEYTATTKQTGTPSGELGTTSSYYASPDKDTIKLMDPLAASRDLSKGYGELAQSQFAAAKDSFSRFLRSGGAVEFQVIEHKAFLNTAGTLRISNSAVVYTSNDQTAGVFNVRGKEVFRSPLSQVSVSRTGMAELAGPNAYYFELVVAGKKHRFEYRPQGVNCDFGNGNNLICDGNGLDQQHAIAEWIQQIASGSGPN